MLRLLIGAWLTISPVQGQSDTTSTVLVEYSETMHIDGLLDVNNYRVTDSIRDYKIYRIGIVQKIDGIQTKDTSVVALITERLPYRTDFWVIVQNVKDKAGNKIGEHNKAWFWFNGFAPNKINKPTTHFK